MMSSQTFFGGGGGVEWKTRENRLPKYAQLLKLSTTDENHISE